MESWETVAKNVRFAKISGKTGECPVGDFECFHQKKLDNYIQKTSKDLVRRYELTPQI